MYSMGYLLVDNKEEKAYPSNQVLLFFSQLSIYGFSASQQLQKNNTKAIYITFLCQLACRSIPA